MRWGDLTPAPAREAPTDDAALVEKGGPWRVGLHYGIHVYEGDRPVATFHDAQDAARAVGAVAAREAPTDDAALVEEVARASWAAVDPSIPWDEAPSWLIAAEFRRARASLALVERAVAGRMRRQALEAREAGYQEALSDVRAAGDLPAKRVAELLANTAAPTTEGAAGADDEVRAALTEALGGTS